MRFSLQPRLKAENGIKEILAAISAGRGNIKEFEKAFAEKFGCSYGTMFSYGRSGLYALMKIWGLQGAEIVCPAYTCVVVQHAIVLSGNIPVFVDCAPGSFNMDLNSLEKAINPNTGAIVVTHLFGNPMDVETIDKIVRRNENRLNKKIYTIQDAAHSFGAKWNGKMVTEYGDASIFGLNISKIIHSVFGGMVITNNEKTQLALQAWRTKHCKKQLLKPVYRLLYLIAASIAFNGFFYALVNWMERHGWLGKLTDYYNEDDIEFPNDWDSLPTNLEANVGLEQLSKYDMIIEARRNNALEWIKQYGDRVQFLPVEKGCTYSHCVGLVENRDKWIRDFKEKGIQLGILIEYSVPEMVSYRGYVKESFPIAGHYKDRTINFPVWKGVNII